ncbi:hypothetical protein GCM10010909_24950 [Acidocella aquatica]|uniref:Uncharacterized protein n=1 Tax=Acidocella aquatica TaxID=1922313 RepID=A0ABQ6ACJ2_9PROT|nr:hypothetical protein GCM10010909_24950 [Acidocella aquatica]
MIRRFGIDRGFKMSQCAVPVSPCPDTLATEKMDVSIIRRNYERFAAYTFGCLELPHFQQYTRGL